MPCVCVRIFAEDAYIIEVLVAVGWWVVVILADAVSGVRYGVICDTWSGVGVAELSCAAFTPWYTLLVGYGFLVDVRTSWCGWPGCCARSFGVRWCFEGGWAVPIGRVGASDSVAFFGGEAASVLIG